MDNTVGNTTFTISPTEAATVYFRTPWYEEPAPEIALALSPVTLAPGSIPPAVRKYLEMAAGQPLAGDIHLSAPTIACINEHGFIVLMSIAQFNHLVKSDTK